MSLKLDSESLDRWLGDFDAFRVDFLTKCHPLCMALGYQLDFDQRQLETAHVAWRASHELWLGHRVEVSTEALSHIKILGLLLYHLSTVSWVRYLFEYNGEYHKFNGTPEQRTEAARDLNAGREACLALYFCTQVINAFEQYRTDKSDGFEYRMTKDLEFDLMHYLLGGEKSEIAVFLILKALYVRD